MKHSGLKRIWPIMAVLLLMPAGMQGQKYRMELGLMGGSSFYMGDANNDQLFVNMHPSFGVMARYHLNDRFSIKANAISTGISGTTEENPEAYMNGEDIHFDRQLLDAGIQLEMNFYNFGAPDYKPGSSRISPYILLGLGMTGYKSDKGRVCANIPFGLGLKVKGTPRFSFGCEWAFKKTFTDDLDYVDKTAGFQLQDSWSGNGSRNKNKDWYSVLMFYVSYDIGGTGSKCFR